MACNRPSTSSSGSFKEKHSDDDLKRRKKEERDKYYKDLVYSERDKLKNKARLRLRRLPRLGHRSPHLAAVSILNNMFNAGINHTDIESCETVPPWVDTEANDIVVTFRNEDVRNSVYNLRSKENKGLYMICDELGEERLTIWKTLREKYGFQNVYTYCGAVHLEIDDKSHRFLTLSEMRKFEKLTEERE